MTSLVTGGGGFIGSNLVDALVRAGHRVISVDNKSANASGYYKNTNSIIYNSDINCDAFLSELFGLHEIDTVFHLAADARIQYSIKYPTKVFDNNFMATARLLAFCREYEVKRFVMSSTSSIYGLKSAPPLKEDMPADCLTAYAISKHSSEEVCTMYYRLYGLETVILRYFNVYGPREPDKGEYSTLIKRFSMQRDAGKNMTIVGDGAQTRDFTHVDDVVEANILASETKRREALGEIFNIGTGKSHSVLEIAKMIGGQTEFIPERDGEARDTLADISKAKALLDWEPKRQVEDYIRETL
jgi:UDP-glucose 4-epimerase